MKKRAALDMTTQIAMKHYKLKHKYPFQSLISLFKWNGPDWLDTILPDPSHISGMCFQIKAEKKVFK
eukprot:gnl/Chilomastix_caulleri/1473.p1 GENE.gnl/Chilomastix_caulleri/1473~~gnl/Chilomastix_caulleri/1473.p1  ORF type:complete len:67 (+),score=16.71 gnl/Chilomastix_caulleri/1473:299-499(+)